MKKLKSRKLWIAVGSALASVGTAIAGMNSDNELIAIVGIVCAVASAAIYEVCESIVDVEREEELREDEEHE
ncbi:MAG: hypothetical protein LUC17_02795 [Oscillospiraceae bacterium]|nr:hypothetical protein [Oscillospiraceae bacterium]